MKKNITGYTEMAFEKDNMEQVCDDRRIVYGANRLTGRDFSVGCPDNIIVQHVGQFADKPFLLRG